MKRIVVVALVSVAALAVSAPAQAETRVYVSLGIPALCIGACGGDPCGGCVWVEGFYRWDGPMCVWVPGHWEPGPHRGVARIARPQVHYHEHNTYIYNYHDRYGGPGPYHRGNRSGYSRQEPGWDRSRVTEHNRQWKAASWRTKEMNSRARW